MRLATFLAPGEDVPRPGEVRGEQVVWALQLLPAMALGLWASRFTATRLDGRWLRPAVLAFAALAGVAALLRALL